jgi:hypothetical protein
MDVPCCGRGCCARLFIAGKGWNVMKVGTFLGLAAAALGAASMFSKAYASSITFSTAADSTFAASVEFFTDAATAPNLLRVTLTNTATGISTNNGQLLENVFWTSSTSLSGAFLNPANDPTHPGATAPDGLYAAANANFGVYGFGTGSGGQAGTNRYGVGGTAFQLNFDASHLVALPGSSPNPNDSPDGPNGGIATATGPDTAQKNAVDHTLVFWLTTVGTLDVANFSNINFTYGTGPEDLKTITPPGTPPPPVPLPAAVWSGMGLLAGMGVVAKWRKRHA